MRNIEQMKAKESLIGKLHENKRHRATLIRTEEEFLNAIENRTGKINLGGSLFVVLKVPGEGWFQYRLSFDGKDTTHRLGNYPQMSFKDARHEADKRTALKNATKEDKRVKRFKRSLTGVKKQRHELAIQSINELQTIYSQVRENPNINSDLKAVTLLALLVPICADSISELKSSNMILEEQLEIHHKNDIFCTPTRLHIDSSLAQLIRASQSSSTVYLFSKIRDLNYDDFKKMIEYNLALSYLPKNVKFSDLEKFFFFICVEEGGFNETFIKEFKANFRARDWAWKYRLQIYAAINWYAGELIYQTNKIVNPDNSKQSWISRLV